jgi:hypothetical protein
LRRLVAVLLLIVVVVDPALSLPTTTLPTPMKALSHQEVPQVAVDLRLSSDWCRII